MARHHSTTEEGHRVQTRLSPLYRLSSVIWFLYSLALLLTMLGSPILAFAAPFRMAVAVATALIGTAMLVRAVVPRRPEWTRWTMPVLGGVSVACFTLTLFASEMAGGLTTSRAGFALLLIIPAFGAYVSWISEKVVSAL